MRDAEPYPEAVVLGAIYGPCWRLSKGRRVGEGSGPWYPRRMDRPVDLQPHDSSEHEAPIHETFEEEFDRLIREDDGSAADEILASGQPISIAREDTPAGHVIRLYPDGREEIARVDREAAARILGR